ncbi:hypothetical protein D3C81_1817050 [compost metagenome]
MAIRIPVNRPLSVRNVPIVSGTGCLRSSEPATASRAITETYRPSSMTTPVIIFQKVLLSASPSKPEPLFAAEETYSYRTCVKPWYPELLIAP